MIGKCFKCGHRAILFYGQICAECQVEPKKVFAPMNWDGFLEQMKQDAIKYNKFKKIEQEGELFNGE
jgi:hypothetical protein